jgi:lipopolysaccharide export system protein LptC
MSVGGAGMGSPRADFRRLPNAEEIARRRRLLRWTKWALPAGALLLLGSIAAWPEIDRSLNAARLGISQAGKVRIESGHMMGARYRGLDTHDRPFTITAQEALQAPQAQQAAGSDPNAPAGDRVNLTAPVADTLGDGGSWVQISADKGVYLQHGQQLDLSRDVTLYRDDGIMMTGPVADLDLKRGVVASSDWVHAEGPFGQLDAQSYLMSQREGIAQFRGPGRLVLNDDHIARPPAANQAETPAPAMGPNPGQAAGPANAQDAAQGASR